MKLKYQAPLIVIGVTLVMTAIAAYSSYSSNVDLINQAKEKELKTVSSIIEHDLKQQSNIAASMASLIVNLPDVKEALQDRDKEKLTKLLLPAFLIQQEKYALRDAHFHVPPLTSFLRLYDLDHSGDDLRNSREILLMANKQKRPLQGVEISRSGVSIRGVDVLLNDDNKIIGSFEVGKGFASITQDIKNYTGFDAVVFIRDDLMTKFATGTERDPDKVIGEYRSMSATDWMKIKPLINADDLELVNDRINEMKTINGTPYGIVYVPLLDFKGEQIGMIVAVSDFNVYYNKLTASLVRSIAFALLQAIILAGTVLLVFDVLLMRPIEFLSKKLQQINTGKTDISFGTILEEKNEIGSLARNIDQTRVLLHDKNSKTENSSSEIK